MLRSVAIFAALICFLSACNSPKPDAFNQRSSLDELKSAPTEPPLIQRKKFTPRKRPVEKIPARFQQRVSISLSENLPIKSALMPLAQQTGIDLQLDPSIDKTVLFTATDRPFIEVIEGICELADLQYSIHKTSIRIQPDIPYPTSYQVQYLNQSRTTDNHTSIATDVFANATENSSPLDNGSNSNLSAKAENDFWAEVKGNLEVILGGQPDSNFTIHRQGGVITVRAKAKQHRLINKYIETLKIAISSQVLIEAKIIEVSLKDDFKAGINWYQLVGGHFRADALLGKIATDGKLTDPLQHHPDILSIGLNTGDFTAILKAIQQFGACKTLSSPRMTVLNNQSALMKVAQNQVYFRLRYDKQYYLNTNRESINVASDIQTVPIGLVMAVHPSIDQETGEIILSLRPTISRLNRSVADPAVDIAYAASGGDGRHKPSLVPVVEVREVDSVLRLKSGEIGVMGGLMESRKASEDSKLPIDIPILDKLISAKSDTDEIVELVILLKASIVDQSSPDAADDRLVNEFVDDPRPL